MKSLMLGLFAETFLHPGTGQAAAAIDLPVAREAATDYPFVAGSSLKGALKDKARQIWPVAEGQRDVPEKADKYDSNTVKTLFGEQENAGAVLVADARLLLLPVRSLSQSYRWATCPHLLERFGRDLNRGGFDVSFNVPQLTQGQVITAATDTTLFLEERSFEVTTEPPQDVVAALTQLIPHEASRERLAQQLAIISDQDFVWFARYGLAVQARNTLKPETKESDNLWYQETLPPDTLLYSLLVERFPGVFGAHELREKLLERPYLQVGGNETVGQGWTALTALQTADSATTPSTQEASA